MTRAVLTDQQERVLNGFRALTRTHSRPPTVRELALWCGLRSSSTVQNHLNTLERKGYLHRRESGTARGMTLAGGEVCPTCGREL